MHRITTECPDRSPLCIAEAIKDIIRLKTVCDIGCREGDMMVVFSKYADKVIGIDWSSENIAKCMDKGLSVTMQSYKDELPKADVYYVWVSKPANLEILSKIDVVNHTVILGGDPSVGEVYSIPNSQIIKVPYNEGDGERQKGIFELTIVGKNSKKEEEKNETDKNGAGNSQGIRGRKNNILSPRG